MLRHAEKERRVLIRKRGVRRHLLRRAAQQCGTVERLAPHHRKQQRPVDRILHARRQIVPELLLRREPAVHVRLRLQLSVQLEHQRAERAVVPPRAKGIGQERRAVAVVHRLVKFIQRAREHPLAQKLRLILVEHAEIGPQRVAARVLTQQVAVLAQQSRAEGVHRFDVRAVDAQQLPLQVRVERVLLQLFAENLGDLAAQLCRRGAGVGDDEKVVKVRLAALNVGKKPLDEHLRLAAARRGGHQQAPPAVLYRRLLLGGQDVSHRVFPLP